MDNQNEKPQEQEDAPALDAIESIATATARERLSRDYDITSAFVRVGTLSKILGISKATIYAAIREKRFFLPHRVLCSSPVVKLDDIATWYAEKTAEVAPTVPTALTEDDEGVDESAKHASLLDTERMVAQTLASMVRRAKLR